MARPDPSSISAPSPLPSPVHERVVEALDFIASSDLASKIPGGTDLARMVMKKVRRDLDKRSEEELRGVINYAKSVLDYVLTGNKPE